jgi:hypothetical protein
MLVLSCFVVWPGRCVYVLLMAELLGCLWANYVGCRADWVFGEW